MRKTKIAVLVSGGGTNLQALIDAQGSILVSGEVALVVSNNAGAYALERAKKAGIETAVVLKKELGSQEAFEARLKEILTEQDKSFDPDIRSGFFFEFTNERFGSGLFECNMAAWERVIVILRLLQEDLSIVDQNA